MNDIKEPCPYCGKIDTLRCMSSDEFDDEGIFDHEFDDNGDFVRFAVCCRYDKGGCGATGGFRMTKEEAIAAWNHRA